MTYNSDKVGRKSKVAFGVAVVIYIAGIVTLSCVNDHLAMGLILFALALPLIVFGTQICCCSSKKINELTDQMQRDVNKNGQREDELKEAIHDLQRFNAVAMNRENRIIELKDEVNKLLVRLNEEKRYN